MKIIKLDNIISIGRRIGTPVRVSAGKKVYDLNRVIFDPPAPAIYNTLILYEKTDEIYEKYDGMLTYEGGESSTGVIEFSSRLGIPKIVISPPKSTLLTYAELLKDTEKEYNRILTGNNHILLDELFKKGDK